MREIRRRELISPEVTSRDEQALIKITSTELSAAEKARILTPPITHRRQELIIALHWHPEFIPMDLIRERIGAMYPSRKEELIIPTQHNEFMTYDSLYSGVEIDCFSEEFNQKVQLLIHLRTERLDSANVLKEMAGYTFKYRSLQLYAFMDAFTSPDENKIERAVRATGADDNIIAFTSRAVGKVRSMLEVMGEEIAPQMIKNKILRNFLDTYRKEFGDSFINRAQAFLQAVKREVKSDFPNHFFYRTREVIEEARSLGAGVIIPHPEQFWPILLAGYDVDGIEVWNPQSRRYTDFLISIIDQKNEAREKGARKLLLLMGDDTHMGEKIKEPGAQNMDKAAREVGLQEAWHEMEINKKLIMAKMTKADMLHAYRERIS